MGSGCGIALVFELFDNAFGIRDVAAFPEIDWLVDAATFFERIEVSHFHHVVLCRNIVVGWDGDIASGNHTVAVVETEHDAALSVDPGDDEGCALDELELQLWSAGVWATWTVGRVHVFEDDAFAIGGAEFFEDIDLVVGCEGGADPAQGGLPNWDHHHQAGEAIDVTAFAQALSLYFE